MPKFFYCIALLFFCMSSIGAADTASEYFSIKRTLASTIDLVPGNYGIDDDEISTGFDDCGTYESILGINYDSKADALAILAIRIIGFRLGLQESNIPERIWRPKLVNLEETLLSAAEGDVDEMFDAFEAAAIGFFNSLNSDLPAARQFIQRRGECGAGEVEVSLRTDPPTATGYIMPLFFFDACLSLGEDPFDRSVAGSAPCREWAIVQADPMFLSGRYVYMLLAEDRIISTGMYSCRDVCPSPYTLR